MPVGNQTTKQDQGRRLFEQIWQPCSWGGCDTVREAFTQGKSDNGLTAKQSVIDSMRCLGKKKDAKTRAAVSRTSQNQGDNCKGRKG